MVITAKSTEDLEPFQKKIIQIFIIASYSNDLILGLWGEIRQWNDGTTIVQKTHDASEHHVLKVSIMIF